jgi:hypothetical protein
MQWNDDALHGKGYVDWYPYDHPQLGQGRDRRLEQDLRDHNPPSHLLKRSSEKFPKWIIWQALLSPKMECVHAGAEALGNDTYRVRLVVQNTGWLPSYVSKEA